jgi:hypothetical protein
VPEHAAAKVAMMTKIGLISDGIRHHSRPLQSGPEGPLFSVQT